ncbi:MAG: AAA family ATPase [Anaerolineales bacterium]|nr:AAA family ATPase [Chloroflexota bacterium]MBL6982962.1 AAA family ATPase [Anaerolineales bacterium]
MSTAILQTKLHMPAPSPSCVPRARLHTMLDAGLLAEHRLILVAAPAGFGKTTLAADWLNHADQQRSGQTAWVSLDEHDNDPARFLVYLISALQTVAPSLGEEVHSVIESPEPPPLEISLTALINQIATLPEKLLIVLDDYHLITNQSIHRGLEFFIENLPAQCHLILLSRADPPLPLARLRARGQMTELRATNLRFTSEEITPFLNQAMQLEISPEHIHSLETRTEGWIAGLQMAALSLKGRSDVGEFIAAFSGSHRFILDYLTEEVVRGQPDDTQQFILQTSILKRLCGPLCEAVTRQRLGQQTLERLEEANLFLSPLDDERCWFRYHRLFADVMANRLGRVYPDKISDLHLQAAGWFRENNLPAEAIEHALAGGDYPFAAQVVESQAMELLKAGSLGTLLGWLDKFPAEIIASRPEMGVTAAWVYLLTGSAENIEAYLTTAESNFPNLDEPEDLDPLRGQIAAIRTYLAARENNPDKAMRQANFALELLPEDDPSVRCVVVFVMGGIYFMQQDLEQALASMQEAAQLGIQAGNIHVAVPALNSAADILLQKGNLADAERILHRALQIGTTRNGQPLPITAGVQSSLAELRIAQGNLASARQFAQTGLELGEKWRNPDSQIGCYLALAYIENLEGNPEAARSLMEKTKHLVATHQLTPGQEEQIKAYEAKIVRGASQALDQSSLPDPLTERELEVLQLLAEGLSNRAIADELIIALGTTKTHISRIMSKLNAENRTQAVALARELGIIS